MPRSRGFPSRTTIRSPRRKVEWFGGVGGTGLTSVSASVAVLLGSGIITGFGEETLIRVRGLFDMFLVSSTSPGDGFFGAIGIGLAPTSAFLAGAASLPQPISELGWDGWLFHHFVSIHEGSPDEAGSGSSQHRFEIDSKAMRIVNTDMTLFAMLEVLEIGTASASVFCDTRFLSKLA